MDWSRFDAMALGLPGATFDVKWGENRVYSVGGRMFAMAGHVGDPEPRYGFKMSELSFMILIESGLARPAPYLARAGWVQIVSVDALRDAELETYVAEAHRLVAARLLRKARAALGLAA